MSNTIQVRREPRRPAPALEDGEFPLQEPPGLPEPGGRNLGEMLMYMPMMVGSGAMMLFFIQPGRNPALLYLSSGIMVVAMLVMGGAMVMRAGSDRKRKLKGERRDYLRYLGQVRKQIRKSVDQQREAVLFSHPEPNRLWALIPTDRLWERRASHADFAEVRIGLGQQELIKQLKAPQTKPIEDLEPLSASGLRRLLRAYTVVEDMPVAVYLRGFARISLDGDVNINRALVRAILAQLATFHSPDNLRIAVFAASDRLRHWDWVKWLPHAQHPDESDAVGSARLIGDTWADLERLLGGKALDERGRFETGESPTDFEPYVVLVLDGVPQPGTSRLAGPGYRNLVALDVDSSLPWDGSATTLRLRVRPDEMERVILTRAGDEETQPIGRPDELSVVRARALARLAAPYRMSGLAGRSTDTEALTADLAALLGVPDLRAMNPTDLWRARSPWDHLRVPIGVGDRGQAVELDLKESAQGGMGPHGILIGATGSGKSELIRTLVLALAATHSSEKLNLVLVDFKGGATFLGLDGLPHVSALITNLADELPLVDRMQDALQGELVRRQELLRKHGHSSILDYERARAGGADLVPLPTLVVIVDEFGELLATKVEFSDLFVMIGRLGRSLGVHLLLASQRFEEGRIHTLETHLSYRIGLKMFSQMESRSVVGSSDAYDQPLPPGTGFLRTDTTTLNKFRGAFVSKPCPLPARSTGAPRRTGDHRIVPFEAGYVIPTRRPDPVPPPEELEADADATTETVLQVLVDRLRDAGPPAHRVWLPPLDVPSTLDELLPPLRTDPQRGFGHPYGGLRVPVALEDRPFEQRREVMVADLSGAKGHVAVIGAPRSGKSTLLRTFVTGLALGHTPREVQFYILDFGGGGMASLGALPHVGTVCQRRDRDQVTRTVAELAGLLDWRESAFAEHGVDSMEAYRRAKAAGKFAGDPYGDVFLVIDGWFTIRQEFEQLEQSIQEIASRGLSYGVHIMVGSARWSEIRPWLRDVLQTRFELRLGDPMESEIDFRKAREVPESAGRGMSHNKYHYLTVLPRIDGQPSTEDAGDGVAALVASVCGAWPGPGAPAVRMLPLELPVHELPAPVADEQTGGELKVAIGLDDQRLEPVWHDFNTTPHLFAFGDAETGKTNLIRLFARAIADRYTKQEAQVVLVDPRRKLQDALPAGQVLGYALTGQSLREILSRGVPVLKARVPGPEIGPERLARRDWWTGPRLFVLIDDYDMISGTMDYPAESLADLLAQGSEIGLHVIITRGVTNAMRGMSDPVLRRMWDLATPGLLFSCPRAEGAFLGETKPLKLPTGRVQYVHRRQGTQLVQIGLVSHDDPPSSGG